MFRPEAPLIGQEAKRMATAVGLEQAWPATVAPESIKALNDMNRLLHNGANAAIEINHFDKSNFLVVLQTLMKYSPTARELPIIIPISYHQLQYVGLKELGKINNISLIPIVTEDTKLAEAKRIEHGKNIPWPILPEGSGNRDYLRAARQAFKSQALVVIAPQAKREPKMPVVDGVSTFAGSPMAHIANQAAKDREFFICPVGIEIPGVEDYGTVREYNVRKPFVVRFGEPMTRADLQTGKEQGFSVDQQAYAELEKVVPAAYRR